MASYPESSRQKTLNDLSDNRIARLVEEFGGHYLTNPKTPQEQSENTVKDALEDPECGLYGMLLSVPFEIQTDIVQPFLGAKKLDDDDHRS